MASREWEEFFVGEDMHVVPIDDIIGHCLNYRCLCGPEKFTPMERGSVWLHSAHDMRSVDYDPWDA